jgi:DNA-binding XRE family transcriptional regulator
MWLFDIGFVSRPSLVGHETVMRTFWVSSPVALYTSTVDHFGMAKPSPTYAGNPALVALGFTIRECRQKVGMSQERLALEVGLDRSYIGGVERGEHNVALMNIIKISGCLNLSAAELLNLAGI